MKKIYGLLGKNIEYSFSRAFFSEKFKTENLACAYVNFDIDTIQDFRKVVTHENLKGLNVTIPYKQTVMPFLDKIDPIAEQIGAVNVIKISKKNELIGFNSDYYGFSNALKPFLHSGIKKALILGTGGASQAVRYALDTLEISSRFVSREPKINQLSYQQLDEQLLQSYLLLINATPLGTYPNISDFPKIPYRFIGNTHLLFDLIYNPEQTIFLQKGKARGAATCNGRKMLILQAEKSWEIWNS